MQNVTQPPKGVIEDPYKRYMHALLRSHINTDTLSTDTCKQSNIPLNSPDCEQVVKHSGGAQINLLSHLPVDFRKFSSSTQKTTGKK